MPKSFLILLIFIINLSGCSSITTQSIPLYQSAEYYNFLQNSFEEYVSVSREWLKANRTFITNDHQKEVNINAPFILKSKHKTDKAALLVHGLGDSAFYFRDLAQSLSNQGIDVYTVLLPGHGSKPSDLFLSSYEDWQLIVDTYANQLKISYKEVWLGGFSTGANLATTHAIKQKGIAGLLLFSPGFQTHAPFLEKLTPIIASFKDWGWKTEETNIARYNSSPLKATMAYSQSAETVRLLLKENTIDIPTFIVMSEADSVIDPEAIRDYFEQRIRHPQKKMLIYGEGVYTNEKILSQTMRLPDLRISTGSHMSPLFSPENAYYGINGEKLMCRNGLKNDQKEKCKNGYEVWFSAWGYYEKNKIHARLTWNPYYKDLEQQIQFFVEHAFNNEKNNAFIAEANQTFYK
jgi:esterase/lipase